MQFNVAQLLKEPIGSIRQYELAEDISQIDPDLAILGPLDGSLKMIRIHSGILVNAEASTAVQVTCNRCLFPIAMPVRFQIEESFRPLTDVGTGRYIHPDEFEGDQQELEDSALLITEQHILDIAEVMRQALWLALPSYPGCNWEGKEECPNLTTYLNDLEEMEQYSIDGQLPASESDAIDPRWASLLKLQGETEEKE